MEGGDRSGANKRKERRRGRENDTAKTVKSRELSWASGKGENNGGEEQKIAGERKPANASAKR